MNLPSPESQFALEVVRQAALLVKQVQARLVSDAITKDDHSPVTIADFASQALVAHLLDQAFPNDLLVGEEESAALRNPAQGDALEQVTRFVSESVPGATPEHVAAWIDRGRAAPASRFWTLDPIDGTKGFLRGEQYVVALALIVDGRVELAALACPHLNDGYAQTNNGPGSLLLAQSGRGAWVTSLENSDRFRQLHVSDISEASQARLLRSVEAGHTNVDKLDEIGEAMGVRAEPLRLDSQAKYAILAAGHGDLIFRLISPKAPNYKEKIWDQAAGMLVCEEAGGKVTDLDGKPLDFSQGRTLAKNRGVLASNGLLHAAALDAIRAVGA